MKRRTTNTNTFSPTMQRLCQAGLQLAVILAIAGLSGCTTTGLGPEPPRSETCSVLPPQPPAPPPTPEKGPIHLSDAIQLARNNSVNREAYRAALTATEATYEAADDWPAPELRMGASEDEWKTSVRYRPRSQGLIHSRRRQALAERELIESRVALDTLDLERAVRQAWAQAQSASTDLKLTNKILILRQAYRKQISKLVAGGQLTTDEQIEVTRMCLRTQTEFNRVRERTTWWLSELMQLTGVNRQEAKRFELDSGSSFSVPDGLFSVSHPAVMEAEARVDMAWAGVLAAKAETTWFRPSFIEGSCTEETDTNTQNWQIQVGIELPLLFGRRQSLNAAEAEFTASKEFAIAAGAEADKELANARRRAQNARQAIKEFTVGTAGLIEELGTLGQNVRSATPRMRIRAQIAVLERELELSRLRLESRLADIDVWWHLGKKGV